MKLCPVSKKLRKYAYRHKNKVIECVELLLYADEVKRLEERLVKSEIELAWKNACDTEEHVKYLQKKLIISENRVAFLSSRLEKRNEIIIQMLPLDIRNTFWEKTGEIGKTKFYMRNT